MCDNLENTTKEFIYDTLEKNYMPYAMSVIISRAIPEIDGFKPAHRKLLYTMYKMGLLTGNRTKSANVVGQTMKLNPHGDASIYETMVRLTRGNESLLHPFVDSKGNFGKQYSRDMAYAAARYTEVKLDGIAAEIFKDINKGVVDFTDNYDGTMKEPVLLPTTFPNVLVSPNQGIAVGMASNISSFNLREVCEGTIAYLKDAECDITDYIVAPDFSTGGEILYDKAQMKQILNSGKGSFKMRAKYKFDKQNSCIEIVEIPYSTTSEAIIDKIIECVKTGKTKEISDVRDESDKTGLKITIDIKKSANPEQLMAKLYKMTPLQDSFGCNFNILIKGTPQVLGVKEIIAHWSLFRMDCVKRGLRYDIDEKQKRLHLMNGLKSILLDIDKAISIIRNTEEEDMVIPNLKEGFGLDDAQAEYVAEIKLRNLNKQYILRGINEIETLKKAIADMENILSSDKNVKKVIIKELEQISKKHGKDRLTAIVADSGEEDVDSDQFIEDYKLKIFLTRDNYLKKISLVSLRAASEQKLKPEDEIICEAEASNKDELLLFTDKGEVYKTKIYEIADCKASTLGEYLPNVLGMSSDEKIIYALPTSDYSGHLLFAFENGKIAKVELKGYATKTNRKKLTNAYYTKVPLAAIMFIPEDMPIVVESRGGRLLCINTALIASKSKRDTQGVQVYLSKRDKYLKSLISAEESNIEDLKPYSSEKIPSSGRALKDSDNPYQQQSLF